VGRKLGGKNRKFTFASQSGVQESAFPTVDTAKVSSSPEVKITEDAKEKERIKEAVASIPDIFSPEQVEWCFDAYVAILCFIYTIVLKTDFKALQDELKIDDDTKKHLSVPLAKVCSKYAPSKLASMSAEIELITTLGLYTVSTFQRARKVAADQVEKKKDENRTKPIDPIRRDTRMETHQPA
jgi:hypothetical protein